MNKKLKRCPFCGNPNPKMRLYKADGKERFRDRYAVLCKYDDGGCGAESGWYHCPEEAAAMWNQRRRRFET